MCQLSWSNATNDDDDDNNGDDDGKIVSQHLIVV